MITHQFVFHDNAYKIIAFVGVVFRKLNLIFYDCLDSHSLPDSLHTLMRIDFMNWIPLVDFLSLDLHL